MTKSKMSRFYAVLSLLLCAVTAAYGQFDRATITGTVTDQSGAVLPNVQILAIRTDTGTSVVGQTNSDGIYSIPSLPVGMYLLRIHASGFKDFEHTGIVLVAAQVLKEDVSLVLQSSTETVVVTAGAPLLETATSDVSTTLESSQIQDLPLSAQGGFDAMNLMLQTVPALVGSQAYETTQNFLNFAGSQSMSNQVFVDGVEATSAYQGQIPTPGLDALQEMQVAAPSSGAITGASGGAELFELKSGTSKLHGSAFYFFQNAALNANGWESNYFLSQCSAGDKSCQKTYGRPFDSLSDWGASAGGPLWKQHTFIFGDYEYYSTTNGSLNPNGTTVPTAQMLTGDFSQLLTGGTRSGTILTSDGTAWINPCTGTAYQYGQIFDARTQQVINGQTCATPFEGNVIPPGLLSHTSQQIAGLFSKYWKPTIQNQIFGNLATLSAAQPVGIKRTIDIKVDHYLSQQHHLSASWDYVKWISKDQNVGVNQGPLTPNFYTEAPNNMVRLIDNYTFRPNVVNTAAVGYSRQIQTQFPQHEANPNSYDIDNPGNTTIMPVLSFAGSNGISEQSTGTGASNNTAYNAFHYQDSLSWLRGRHSFQFGGTFMTQATNTSWGYNVQQYAFDSATGGPIDPGLTPWVGNGFASFMLGNVQSANEQVLQSAHPRQKYLNFFAVDDFKVTSKFVLNLGLRWDITLPGHEASGRLSNFDPHLQNPNWAPYYGAWAFSKNSGTTFETDNNLHQFGPHVGFSYQLSKKLVARASYGLFYVPLGALNGGQFATIPANQTSMAYGVNQVNNNVKGATAFNWDNGYPGVSIVPPQNITATSLGTANYPMYTHPHMLFLGHSQNFNIGFQYEVARNVLFDVHYLGMQGGNLHDPGRSYYQNYPSFSVYQPVLLSGNIYTQINSPADAAAVSAASGVTVPYPYPGFSGPAYAAIAPYPQVASKGAFLESFGDPATNDKSSFNALIFEAKARNAHGWNFDESFTMSKWTGASVFSYNYANNWGQYAQNLEDWKDANHWIQLADQKYVLKGNVMYEIPTWRGATNSRLIQNAISGWEVGLTNTYGSGTPIAWVISTYQLPYFFMATRANFANGANRYNIKNTLNRKLVNPTAPLAAGNNDFNVGSFATTTPNAPFGNTPFGFNHWRWNPGIWHENLSIMKHFNVGRDGQFRATVRGDLFDVFNRHYFNSPDTDMRSATFGQVTGASGNRVGQIGFRLNW